MDLSSNISSIQADQTLLNSNAHNIANVNTEGFIPSSGQKLSGVDGNVSASISKATDTGSPQSQTDLSKALTDQITLGASVDVNATAIKTQDQLLGSLLDIKA